MLKLRLKRVGRKHDPSFRVVVTEATTAPQGKYLEAVGFYNARLKQLELKADRIQYWLSVGIQPTDTVHNLLVRKGIIEGSKISVHSTRVRKKTDEASSTPAKGEGGAPTESGGAGAATVQSTDAEKAPAEEEAPQEESAPATEEKKDEIDSDKKDDAKQDAVPEEVANSDETQGEKKESSESENVEAEAPNQDAPAQESHDEAKEETSEEAPSTEKEAEEKKSD